MLYNCAFYIALSRYVYAMIQLQIAYMHLVNYNRTLDTDVLN